MDGGRKNLCGNGRRRTAFVGPPSTILTFVLLYGIAFLISLSFYDFVEKVLNHVSWSFSYTYRRLRKHSDAAGDTTPFLDTERPPRKLLSSTFTGVSISLGIMCSGFAVLLLQVARPTGPPFGHLSGTLPISLMETVFFQPMNM